MKRESERDRRLNEVTKKETRGGEIEKIKTKTTKQEIRDSGEFIPRSAYVFSHRSFPRIRLAPKSWLQLSPWSC